MESCKKYLEDRIRENEVIPKGSDWIPFIGAIRLGTALNFSGGYISAKLEEPMFHTFILYHVVSTVAITAGIVELFKYLVKN